MTKNKSYGKLCALFYDATKQFANNIEVSFYESFIKNKKDKILEAMSGSGRLQIPLLERGYNVHGVDNSTIMLEHCKKRALDKGLNPVLFEQDIETMLLPETYNLVTIAVGSFQLITDKKIALNCLKNIRAHMYLGAEILIDFFIPETQDNISNTREVSLDLETKIRLTTRYKFDIISLKAFGFCNYELLINNKIKEEDLEIIEICWYTEEELKQLLIDAGFKIIKTYKEKFKSTVYSDILHAIAI